MKILVTLLSLVLAASAGCGAEPAPAEEAVSTQRAVKRKPRRVKKIPPKRAVKKTAPRPIQRDPEKGEEMNRLGLRARADGDNARAVRHFEQAGQLGFVRGWKDAASTYIIMGKRDKAIAALDQYLEDEPNGEQSRTVRQLRERLIQQGQ